MKSSAQWMSISFSVICLVACCAVPLSIAQARRSGARKAARDNAGAIRIRKIEGIGRRALVNTPRFDTTVGGGAKQLGKWGRILVTYDSEPEWIDELTFSYYALSMKADGGKNAYCLYKVTVNYEDVAKGRGHLSTVFLRPNVIKRYGFVAAVAVEISYKGKVVAEEFLVDKGAKLPSSGKWWKNPAVIDSKAVTSKPGYLLSRADSPFALVNIDDYEVIK